MKERVIYRPNCFTLEQWEALSREEQIAWWKAQRKDTPPKPYPVAKLVDNRHKVSDKEFQLLILLNLNEQNAEQVFQLCPGKDLDAIRSWLSELPSDSDEQGWSKSLYLRGVSYAPWVTPEEIEASQQAEQKRFHEAVQIFRARDNHPESGGIKS